MNAALLAILIASPTISVLGPAVVVVMISLILFVAEAGIICTPAVIAALFLLVLAVPSSAFLAVSFLRKLIEQNTAPRFGSMELLALALAGYVGLHANSAVTLFGAAGFLGKGLDGAMLLQLVTLTISRVLFVGALCALTTGIVVALAEITVGFCSQAMAIPMPISFAAVRQIVIILVVAAGFDLAVGLFGSELAPLTLLRGATS